MRGTATALALLAALLLPVASHADEAEGAGAAEEAESAGEAEAGDEATAGDEAPAEEASAEEAPAEEAEEEEPSAWSEYLSDTRTRALTGMNGILTWPADPVMAAVKPPEALEEAGYAQRPLGFGSGILLMLYRSFTGAVDLLLAPIPGFPVVSPVPRYKLIPGFEHADE
jgi:hypothetical protein